jgi:hypothetical protein
MILHSRGCVALLLACYPGSCCSQLVAQALSDISGSKVVYRGRTSISPVKGVGINMQTEDEQTNLDNPKRAFRSMTLRDQQTWC